MGALPPLGPPSNAFVKLVVAELESPALKRALTRCRLPEAGIGFRRTVLDPNGSRTRHSRRGALPAEGTRPATPGSASGCSAMFSRKTCRWYVRGMPAVRATSRVSHDARVAML